MKRIILYLCIIFTVFVLLFIPEKTSAQRVNSLYFLDKTPFHTQWNPAMAPDKSGLGLGIGNISLSVQSDLAFSDIFVPSQDGTELYTFLHPSVNKEAFVAGLKDVSSLSFNSNIDIFNLGIRVLDKYFTIHSGISIDAGTGIPKDFFGLFLLGMNKNEDNTNFNLTEMNINAMAYTKLGVGYSMKLGKLLSVGINANYLQGIADMRMGFDKLTIGASQTKWDVTSNGYIQMAAPDFLRLKYGENGYLNGVNYDSKTSGGASGIVSALPKAGSGFSIDLGITAKPLSFLTLSAAIIDLGSIKWNAKYIQRASSNSSYTYDGAALNETEKENQSSTEVVDNFEDIIHFEKDNNPQSYSSKLTTKLNIGAEAGILNNHISFGVLSQTGFAPNGTYQDIMLSANLKPSSIIQGALTYSLLHGKRSSLGAAINCKLLFLNIFVAADYIPFNYTPQMIPVDNSYYNMQFGINMMF